jgi:antitoxin (DNA-binding transcriptional repressor) of toxin-antitoxin stability system
MKVSVADAKNRLPELIKAAEGGEPVTICRRGVPVVDIVRTTKPTGKKRTLGTLRGKIQVLDQNWWKPMTDEEVEAFVAIKSALGKLRLSAEDARRAVDELGVRILPYTSFHLFELPLHHRDPFDRQIIAQALVECDDFSLQRAHLVRWSRPFSTSA